jgi:DNA-binding transcriptional regulator LsrR (DeoR family)
VDALVPSDKKNLTVTQLVGGLNAQEAHINSDDIVRDSAKILNANPYFMYAPIIVESKQLRDSMLGESFFSQVYNIMKNCTVAVVGIGNVFNRANSAQRFFMSGDEYALLTNRGAVGEICTHFYDIDGKIIKSDINDRVFAIDCDSLKKIPLRIGVAGGEEKIAAIIGAVRGKLINVLITNGKTAKALQKLK